MRLDRLLAITIMLLNRDRVAARELAEYFEVSIRTIYRDIEAIDLAGIPIIAFQGLGGGFGIMENFKLDRQVLTLNDMLAILSALKGINVALEDRELDSAIEKISSLVPKEKSAALKLHSQQFVVDILPWWAGKGQKEMVKSIQYSLSKERMIRFTYCNTKGERTSRTVEPMTLLFKGYAWYLFAYCRLKEDYRLFRLSRMSDLAVTAQAFTRRDASYQDYFKPQPDQAPPVKLVLKFSHRVRFRVEDYFGHEQVQVTEDGHLVVTVSWPEDEWVYSHLLSYGEDLEVLEPPHIRSILLEKAQKIAGIYKPDIGLS